MNLILLIVFVLLSKLLVLPERVPQFLGHTATLQYNSAMICDINHIGLRLLQPQSDSRPTLVAKWEANALVRAPAINSPCQVCKHSFRLPPLSLPCIGKTFRKNKHNFSFAEHEYVQRESHAVFGSCFRVTTQSPGSDTMRSSKLLRWNTLNILGQQLWEQTPDHGSALPWKMAGAAWKSSIQLFVIPSTICTYVCFMQLVLLLSNA